MLGLLGLFGLRICDPVAEIVGEKAVENVERSVGPVMCGVAVDELAYLLKSIARHQTGRVPCGRGRTPWARTCTWA